MVVIVDRCGAGDALIDIIEFDGNLVVGPLLPVLMPRRAGGGAVLVGGRKNLLQLTELIKRAALALGLQQAGENGK